MTIIGRELGFVMYPPSSGGGGGGTITFIGYNTINGDGSITYPAGTQSGDMLILCSISNSSTTIPSGWTNQNSFTWTGYGYYDSICTKIAGGESSTGAITLGNGSSMLVVYRGPTTVGTVGTFVLTAGSDSTVPIPGITPSSSSSLVLGFTVDRDNTPGVQSSGWTNKVSWTATYFGFNCSERAFGSTSPTGTQTWTQTVGSYAASGILIEIL